MASDSETSFEAIKERIQHFNEARDWGQFHTPKNLSMALAAEAAELMEHFLWQESADSIKRLEEPERHQKIREELADVLIYALEFCNVTGIDAAQAIEDKMKENARKYPVEKARGVSKKYTEL